MDAAALLQDALRHLGVRVRRPTEGSSGKTLLLDLGDGVATVEVLRRSLVDERGAERLIADRSEALLVVVADRVTYDARRRLLGEGLGFLDLRGHVGLIGGGVVINAEVPPTKSAVPSRSDPLAGDVGLEVATRLLMAPAQSAAVRALARELDRSPSTVSTVLAGLRHEGLVDDEHTVNGTDLFWRVAERWPNARVHLHTAPARDDPILSRSLRLGIDDVATPGWALTGAAAAAAYGAPIAHRSGQRLDFLVPDEAALHRAIRLLGTAHTATQAEISARVAPAPLATQRRVSIDGDWPLAHPLFVALDLAQDVGRGREILDAWTPTEPWSRVW